MSTLPYQIITDRICALLDQGTVPWHQPWQVGPRAPRNLTSGRPYRGINLVLLGAQHYTSPYWLTYKQCQATGGQVRQGARSTPVVFWKIIERRARPGDAEEAPDRLPVLRYYNVFNTAQCDGLTVPEPEAVPDVAPLAACEALVAGMPTPPTLQHGRDRAYYHPATDTVALPDRARFPEAEAYYSTLYHELTHATGHASRLNRPTLTDLCPFGSTNYSKEELVAEMGAAYLCGLSGIANQTIDQSAAYIQSWLARLRQAPKLLVHAAAQAQKAADYIQGVAAAPATPTEN